MHVYEIKEILCNSVGAGGSATYSGRALQLVCNMNAAAAYKTCNRNDNKNQTHMKRQRNKCMLTYRTSHLSLLIMCMCVMYVCKYFQCTAARQTHSLRPIVASNMKL